MHEDAYEIFEYLPIRVNTAEDEYIKHLWDAFVTLDSGSSLGRSFSIMPFHLLYMLALQYKVIRISSELPDSYKMAFTAYSGREKESIMSPQSVFDIALLSERTIPDLLRLIDVGDDGIRNSKKLIDNRNDSLAHAKGGIERDPENKISEYLFSLKLIQDKAEYLNTLIAKNWVIKIKENDVQNTELQNFIESQLLDSHLCPGDFKTGSLNKAYKTYFEQL
jgi:hypothetical protein